MLLGSVAEALVRAAPCPVLVARDDLRRRAGPRAPPGGRCRREPPRPTGLAAAAVLAALALPPAGAACPPPGHGLDARPDLAGVWEGTYESRDTGRLGDVYLALTADGDSTVGEVVMVPRGAPVSVRVGRPSRK